MNDSLFRLLGELPQAESGRARSDRVRLRCHSTLANHRSRPAARHGVHRLWEPVVVGMGCLYFAGVVREALWVYGAW